MKTLKQAGVLLAAGAILLATCRKKEVQTPVGTWYEQSEDGGRIIITKNSIAYERDQSYRSDIYKIKKALKMTRQGEKVLLEADDFMYVDMYYDVDEDMVVVHTYPHTDGDGGHHRIEYKRYEYQAPPAPVYGMAVDHSDPNAKKEFSDLRMQSMKVSFYDAGPYHDPNSDMARPLPYPDHYWYDLHAQEDGSALVSSSFCQEIQISKDILDQLQKLIIEVNLGEINGIDIHTEGVPDDAPSYTMDLVLRTGEEIHSSANWENIPKAWNAFQEPMHHLLFFAFMDAGYETSGQFHSTRPMKRVWSEGSYREESGISYESVKIEPDWDKAFDYSLDTSYFIFEDKENRYPVLMKTLHGLSDQYKEIAEKELKKDYEVMQKLSRKEQEKAERKYCYSFYAVSNWSMMGKIFSFILSEGHANSLVDDYGGYRYIRYNIDVETGEILSLADLFNDSEELYDLLLNHMLKYGTHNDIGRFIHSDAFPDALHATLDQIEPEGIGFNITYKYLELWFPLSLFPSSSQLRELLYYEDIQDLLKDSYAEVK